MKITYTARKVNLRDNFKERCEKKLSKFNRIFSEDASVNVVVTLEKNRQTVEPVEAVAPERGQQRHRGEA